MWWPRLSLSKERVLPFPHPPWPNPFPTPRSPQAQYLNSIDHGIKTNKQMEPGTPNAIRDDSHVKAWRPVNRQMLPVHDGCVQIPRASHYRGHFFFMSLILCVHVCAKRWVRDAFSQGCAQQGPLSRRVCRFLCGTLLPPNGTAPSPALSSW